METAWLQASSDDLNGRRHYRSMFYTSVSSSGGYHGLYIWTGGRRDGSATYSQ